MTLIGVRAAGETELKLNPGLNHILAANDTVFYIGFTREEYSKVRGPANVRHTLWHACATWAILAMVTSGIDPYELESKYGNHEVKVLEEEGKEGEQDDLRKEVRSLSEEREVKFFVGDTTSLTGDSARPSKRPSLVSHDGCLLEEGSGGSGGSGGSATPMNGALDDQQRVDALRGMQLLRFHSKMNMHPAAAPVKVNLVHRDSSISISSMMQRMYSAPASHRPSIISVQSTNGRPSVASSGSSQVGVAIEPPSVSHSRDVSISSTHSDHHHRLSGGIQSHRGSQRNFGRLSDVPEESVLERRDSERLPSEPPGPEGVYTLRDAEEGRVQQHPFRTSGPLPIARVSNVRKQMSMPEAPLSHHMQASGTGTGSYSTSKRLSSLVPPPLDLSLTRSASEGKLPGNIEDAIAAAPDDPETPNTLRRMGYYSSEQNLLNPSTPASASRHVMMNMPSPVLARRRPTILSNLSRKLSVIERTNSMVHAPAALQEEVRYHNSK